jgi:hypothetical protein
MAFGTPGPGALQYPVVAPAAQQLAQAAQAAPQANADAAEKMAATQAQTQVDKSSGLEAELKQSQTQDAIVNRLIAIPGIETSPTGKKALEDRFKTLGIPLPKNELGQIDMKAVRAVFATPVKPWAQWTPKEVSDSQALQPELRNLPPDAPELARTQKAVTPLTEKGAEFLHAPVVRAETALAAGHGNLQSVLMAARAEKAALTAKGADTSAVDTILTEDGKLQPEYAAQKANDLVQAQIDNLHSLGIYRTDEEQIKSRNADEKVREWNNPSANAKLNASVKERQQQIQSSQFAQKMTMAKKNLDARYSSILNSSDANKLRAGTLGINMYENRLKQTETAQKDAQAQLDKTNTLITGMLNSNPNIDITNSVYAGLIATANGLNDSINGNAAKGIPSGRAALDAARLSANNGIANVYNQITGNTGLQQPNITINTGAAPGTTYPGGRAQAPAANHGAVVETRIVNGVSMSKFADGSFGPTP